MSALFVPYTPAPTHPGAFRADLVPYVPPAGGVPFLPDELVGARLSVLLAFGADLSQPSSTWDWFDAAVAGDVLFDPGIAITVGRADETATSYPATCALTLLNLRGDYSAKNPQARWWPYVREGTPLWVQVYVAGVWYTRFQGTVDGFTPSWDESGNYAVAKVQAYGELYRIGQGPVTLKSALSRAITHADPQPVAAWLLDDGNLSTQAANLVDGAPLVPYLGVASYKRPTFGVASDLAGSVAVVAMASPGYIRGLIGPYVYTGTSTVEYWFKIEPAVAGTQTALVSVRATGTMGQTAGAFYISAYTQITGSSGLFLETGVQTIDTAVDGPTYAFEPYDRKWHHVCVSWVQSGADIATTVYVDGHLASAKTLTAMTVGTLTKIYLWSGDTTASVITASTVSVWSDTAVNHTYAPGTGHMGENAIVRLQRLCGQERIALTVYGTSNKTMGPQGVDTLPALLRECEAADAGSLYDGASDGLTYQAVADRWNQPVAVTLDASAGEIVEPFEPVVNAFTRANRFVVNQKGGSSASFEDTDGPLGTKATRRYEKTLPATLNLADTTGARILDRAAFEVRRGTVDKLRYPTLTVNLRKIPTKIPAWLAMRPGQLIAITPPYAGTHPPDQIQVIPEGWTEHLTNLHFEVTFNSAPADPYNVYAIGDTARGRLGVDLSRLDSDIGGADVSFWVTSQSLWTTTATYPQDFPIDANLDGERITVTAIVGATNPQLFTVTRSVNGVTKAHPAGTRITGWAPVGYAL